MSNDTRVPTEVHIVLPSKKKNSSNVWTAEKEKQIVTRSVFELQKSFSTQNSSPDNFQNILLNKLLHRRPLTLIFGDRVEKKQLLTANDSCWQLFYHQHHDIHPMVDKYAKFQLNQMIRCWVIQLLSENWGILSDRQTDGRTYRCQTQVWHKKTSIVKMTFYGEKVIRQAMSEL